MFHSTIYIRYCLNPYNLLFVFKLRVCSVYWDILSRNICFICMKPKDPNKKCTLDEATLLAEDVCHNVKMRYLKLCIPARQPSA